MYKFCIITVGPLKEQYHRDICAEYAKRLAAYCRLERREIQARRLPDSPSRAEINAALDAEGVDIMRAVPRGAYLIALCVEGRRFTSESFAVALRAAADSHPAVAFVIGSSYGLSENVKKSADLCLSVSDMTFPHGMMQAILYEIIYRSLSIISGGKYHK